MAWAALVLQFGIIVAAKPASLSGVLAALWHFLGYFTILTNLLVAMVALALALGRDNFWTSARLRFVALTAIVLVGLVYSFALRSTWQPQGWSAVADHALHDATPVLFSLTWLLHRHGGLNRRDVVAALAWPSAYCAYALARGAIDGWYAYWFLNPNEMSFAELAVTIALMLAAFLIIAAALLWMDRWLARRTA